MRALARAATHRPCPARVSPWTPKRSFSSPVSPLTDTHSRFHSYLRISLTERCNLRCTYCMPEQGVDLTPNAQLLSAKEIAQVVSVFVGAGVTKVRFTGGEPLVRSDVEEIFRSTGALLDTSSLQSLCLTTNGIVLSRKLPSLLESGLSHLNISLDTFQREKFFLLTRRDGHHLVMKSIQESVQALKEKRNRLQSVKLNCVIQKGVNCNEILDFVDFTRLEDVEVRFIEYMPFEGNRWNDKKFLPYQQIIHTIQQKYADFQLLRPGRDPHEKSETAKLYHVPGFAGRVGFITSMSDHFCSSCNRLRVTADGNLKVCLFGNSEVSLRDVLRATKEGECVHTRLLPVVESAVQRKQAKHAGLTNLIHMKNRPMIKIGG